MGLGKLTFLNKAKTVASAKVAQARKVLSDSKDDTRDKLRNIFKVRRQR